MEALQLSSALEQFYEREAEHPQKVFLRQPLGSSWIELTWEEVGRQARCVAQTLRELGCGNGDRVAILAKNCAHWIMADLAIMMAGCVSVPLYATQHAEALEYVLRHSETKLIFVGKVEYAEVMEAAIPQDIMRVRFPYNEALTGDRHWDEIVKGKPSDQSRFIPDLDQLATIVYTSGTTGFPKGVMHSFRTIAFASIGYRKYLGFSREDQLFSYLPLSHVAERVLVEMMGLYGGATISFAGALETFGRNLREVAPTAFFSVPRLWMKFQQGVLEKMPQEKLDRLLKVPLLNRWVKYKIKKGLGLHRSVRMGSGAAPIAPALLEWFRKIDIEILEGYGLTENFGFATSTPKGEVKIGTVGRVMPDAELKIDLGGEILTKSGANTLGYYKDPVATAMIFNDEGFLRTGDIGQIDSDGYLRITGRVKEIFKTDKGKYIAPSPIEHKFIAESTYIEQLCVTGQSLSQPIALCVLNAMARQQPREDVTKAMADSLRRLNAQLEKHEQIERCILIDGEWTVDAGLMTPTLKIRRHTIEARYKDLIARSSRIRDSVIWEEAIQLKTVEQFQHA